MGNLSGNNGWFVPNEGYNQPSSHAIGGNGGLYSREAIQYRNPLDARRSTALRDGAYPDGYLGFQSGDRQQDKLLEALGKSLNSKPYQRGVHKGAKVGAQDYFWPPDFQPDLRLKAEANYVQSEYTMDVKRAKPHGSPIEMLASSTSKHPVTSPLQMNDYRKYGVNPGVNAIVPRQPSKAARKFGYLPSYAT